MRLPLATITAASLRHRKLVVFLWVLLAGAGALTATTAVRHMTYSYATPGQPGYEANQHLMARFGIDPTIEPTIAVLHLPPGESMRTAAGRAIAARVFAAAPRAGIVAVAGYATTHNPKLISADGQATWAVMAAGREADPLGPRVLAMATANIPVAQMATSLGLSSRQLLRRCLAPTTPDGRLRRPGPPIGRSARPLRATATGLLAELGRR